MLTLFGWWKKVKPIGKKLFRICSNPENDLVEVIRSRKNATYIKCEIDAHSLMKIMNIIAVMMSAGKMDAAAKFCKMVAEKCFGQSSDNPYRLMFLTIAMMAECEAKFYDLSFFRVCAQEQPLKVRYSLCQQSATGFLEMAPTIFKISDLLTMCEEFSHFSCFRQCHVNLFKNLAEIGEDENVDWFDRLKVLDSNILALINDSDVASRFCENEKDKRKLQQKLHQKLLKWEGQYCFSWFQHLHFREICVRSTAAIEILKSEQAYVNFVKGLPESSSTKPKPRKTRKRLEPQHPETEEQNPNKVLVDSKKPSKLRRRKKLVAPENIFITDVEDFNYNAPFADGQTFSSLNAERMKNVAYYRKERERFFDGGGKFPIDPRKRMPASTRCKIRMIVRKIMAEAREMQQSPVLDDELMNKAFPVSDDEHSDDEMAPKTFFRTETLESVKKKNARKFGILDPRSEVKKVLWWHNAKDELLTARAIPNHCVKINGESSDPFSEYEQHLGKPENGGNSRDRISESRREANCRAFDLQKESSSNDGALLTMPTRDLFKDLNQRRPSRGIRLNSLTLQNMRRRCVDELLILMMIIKGQQQLQEGNVVRCLAYLMLIEFKLAVNAENNSESHLNRNNNFDPYIMHLYKCLLAKFRLYSTDLFGKKCLNSSEELLLEAEKEKFDLNKKCYDFCRATKAYYFCICIRGRTVQFDLDDLNKKYMKTEFEREDVEKQHEFFFGLDNANKNTHLNSFWRTECLPIVSGLIHITNHSLLESVDKMCSSEAEEFLDNLSGLSKQTRSWLKLVTKNGFLVQKPSGKGVTYKDTVRSMVPMLFQLPSRYYPRRRTEDMMDHNDLGTVYEAITAFVRQKNDIWKAACKADKENLRRTNRDSDYRQEDDMTLFGESIEKDIYMVAVYKGEKLSEESQVITDELHTLCRELRSQSGFISIKPSEEKK